MEFDWKTGGVKAIHVKHNLDKKGGVYELACQNGGYDEATVKRGIARYVGYQKVKGFKFVRFDEIICVQDERIVFLTHI